MNVNYIVLADFDENKAFITVKCQYCNSRDLIRNHISWIKDYINDQDKLHGCKNCGAKTRIHPEDLKVIKKKLGAE